MITLGEQLERLILSRNDEMQNRSTPIVAYLISERMKENTMQGHGFDGNGYEPYEPGYKAWRERKGYETGRVTLRAGSKRIEETKVSKPGKSGVMISFTHEGEKANPRSKSSARFGEAMKMHHDGTASGGKTRPIFPRQASEVRDMKPQFMKIVAEVLDGRKS